jgi:hypothetical protein
VGDDPGRIREPAVRQVNALAVSVKSLDKLIEFGVAKPNESRASRTDMAETRVSGDPS